MGKEEKIFEIDPDNIILHEDWYRTPIFLNGDFAAIKIPSLYESDDMKHIKIPHRKYYPNGKICLYTLLSV